MSPTLGRDGERHIGWAPPPETILMFPLPWFLLPKPPPSHLNPPTAFKLFLDGVYSAGVCSPC